MRFARGLPVVATAALLLAVASLVEHHGSRPTFAEDAAAAGRSREGLLVLYDFNAGDSGDVIRDRSGVGQPLNLKIDDPKAVKWDDGSLEVRGKTLIRSEQPARKVIDAVRDSGEITVEAWIRPTDANQSGPARIVTISRNSVERNFTLGHEGNRFEARLRTTKTSNNGLPAIASPSGSLATKLTHVVYTRERSGRARIYLDGKLSSDETVAGDASNWDRSFHLALANELSGDRPWRAAYHRVAIYSRALSSGEATDHFRAGPRQRSAPLASAAPPPAPASRALAGDSPSAAAFRTSIAPLLVQHCLECHDSPTREGGLDLSRRDAALAGGDSGKVLVPGKPGESLLWEAVDSDDMPQDRPPLSAEEKAALRKWIESGAEWPIEKIDPAVFARDRGPVDTFVRRLTVDEYIETVRSAVGVDIELEARRRLPADVRADGFSNTAYNLNVDLSHVEAYANLARLIAARLDAGRFARQYTDSTRLDQQNMRRLIEGMGKWLLRGPLQEHEVEAYLAVSSAVEAQGGEFDEAVSYLLEAMLQSPRFIYRIENQHRSERAQPVGQYELASRMSYAVWGAPPDRELMRAAEAGELSSREAVAAQVRRMLNDPRAVERSATFLDEWLNLGRLNNLNPNPQRFPNWNAQLAADMRDETLAFFKHVAWEENRPLADLLNAQVTFATPLLARHYGFKPQDASEQADSASIARLRPGGDLLALYTFAEGGGEVVRDVSGNGEPLDLKIDNPSAVTWGEGSLTVKGSASLATAGPPRRLIEALKQSGSFTVAAWITPADGKQNGPARIVSLSSGPSQRNFTLGQEADRFDVRFRTNKTDANGMPSTASRPRSAGDQLTHVVYTRSSAGRALLYINGEEHQGRNVDGDLSNWDDSFRLVLANETSGDRPWRGVLHQVAIYRRALSAEEARSQSVGPLRYDVSQLPGRGGLLTQGSVLTVGGDHASMVSRGLFLLHELLRGTVKDPPPCVDTTPVATQAGLSQRGIAEQRLANVACGGCHARFEPLAFGLEKFDGVGAYHDADAHGNKLRDDGEVLFPGEAKPVSYSSSAELMDLLASSDRVRECITWKVVQFALGAPPTAAEAPQVEMIHREAQANGGTYAAVITALMTSDLIRMKPAEPASHQPSSTKD